MRVPHLAASLLVLSALLIAQPADASPVSFNFTAEFTTVNDLSGGLALNGITVGTLAFGTMTWDTDAIMVVSDTGVQAHGGGTAERIQIHAGLIYIDSPLIESISIGANADVGGFRIGAEGTIPSGTYAPYPGPREAWLSLQASDPSLVPVGPEALFDFDPTIWSGGQLALYGNIGSKPPYFQAFARITSLTVPEPSPLWTFALGLPAFTTAILGLRRRMAV